MEPRLQNWKHMPPPGGWGRTISIKGQNFQANGPTADAVVRQIIQRYQQNGIPIDRQKIWDECNAHWCAKAPGRCGGQAAIEASKSIYIPKDNTKTTPSEYGSKLWGMLDTFGMAGAFNEGRWRSALEHIRAMLDPGTNPETGCSECHNEWHNILKETPFTDVTNSAEAARWVFQAHNRVNRKAGKPQAKWERMAIRNHWEV